MRAIIAAARVDVVRGISVKFPVADSFDWTEKSGIMDAMKALRFERTGSLDNLSLVEAPMPVPAGSDLLVKVGAAALNPSDAKNVLGRMHETSVPRIPGRDFAGVVTQGPAEWMGRTVFGTGGDLGFGRDGSHAEFVVIPREAVVAAPAGATPAQAAAIGLPYVTAWTAISRANLRSGETILILGTNGSVGAAAARLAHRAGARVIGVVRAKKDLLRGETLPVDAWINLETTGLADGCRALTGGAGADVVLDTVGGAMFGPCLASLARRGRQAAIASAGTPQVAFNLVDFYHNESSLVGVDSLKVGFAEAAEILRNLVPAFEKGELPLADVQAVPLERGPEFYRLIDSGQVRGKVALTP
jgi:NADPH2:quinone reductase